MKWVADRCCKSRSLAECRRMLRHLEATRHLYCTDLSIRHSEPRVWWREWIKCLAYLANTLQRGFESFPKLKAMLCCITHAACDACATPMSPTREFRGMVDLWEVSWGRQKVPGSVVNESGPVSDWCSARMHNLLLAFRSTSHHLTSSHSFSLQKHPKTIKHQTYPNLIDLSLIRSPIGSQTLPEPIWAMRREMRLPACWIWWRGGIDSLGPETQRTVMERRPERRPCLKGGHPKPWENHGKTIGKAIQGLVNVPNKHHPTIGYIIPQKGHLPTPDIQQSNLSESRILESRSWTVSA